MEYRKLNSMERSYRLLHYGTIFCSVHNLISMKLKKWRECLLTATEEMREDFMMSMKKAIVDFVLKDPNTVELFFIIKVRIHH